MYGRVVNGGVEAARGDRQIVELRVDAREGRVFLIMAAGGEAVQRIAEDVDGDGMVAAERQAIGQPAVSRSQVGDAERPAKLLLDAAAGRGAPGSESSWRESSIGPAGVR